MGRGRTGTVKLSIQSSYDDKGTKQAERALERFQKRAEAADGSMAMAFARSSVQAEQFGRKMQSLGDSMSRTGDKLTRGVTLPLIATGGAAVNAAVQWETAFAGVEKTVDGTAEQMAALEQGIRDMAKELPTSREEIAGVAEAAGQLGIQTDNVLAFTRVMVDLGESTNLSATDAATAMARFANITQMSQDDFDKLGSAVVDLGNNMATTESEIVDMGLRLAGAGKQVGMSEAEIMGLAAALSSVGIEAEAGGSAISKTMINIASDVQKGGSGLARWAKTAQMSADQFVQAWEEDPSAALNSVITGLANMEAQGGSTLGMLEDLGITEVRQRDALLRLAGAGDILTDAVSLSNDAWAENSALTTEATKRYETTASKLAIAKNRVTDAAVSLGEGLAPALIEAVDAAQPLIDWATQQAQAFSDLDKEQQQQIIQWAAVAAAAGPALSILGRIVSTVGTGIEVYGKLSASLAAYIAKRQAATAADATAAGALGKLNSASLLAKGGYVALAATVGYATGTLISQLPAIKANAEAMSKLASEANSVYEYLNKAAAAKKPWWAYTGALGSAIYGAQVGGGAAGLAAGKVPLYGAGGHITSPEYALLAERGHDEYVITTEPAYRSRSLSLYEQLGDRLGVSSSSVTIAPGAVQINVSGSSASPALIAAEVEAALRRIVRSSQLMGA